MFVCLCAAVTEREIERLKAEGVRSISQLQKLSEATQNCGSCLKDVKEMLDKGQQMKRDNP